MKMRLKTETLNECLYRAGRRNEINAQLGSRDYEAADRSTLSSSRASEAGAIGECAAKRLLGFTDYYPEVLDRPGDKHQDILWKGYSIEVKTLTRRGGHILINQSQKGTLRADIGLWFELDVPKPTDSWTEVSIEPVGWISRAEWNEKCFPWKGRTSSQDAMEIKREDLHPISTLLELR